MSGLRVRRAVPEDGEAIAGLAASREFAARWSAAAYAQEAAREGSIVLVAEDGETRGYAVARVEHGECRLLDLASFADGRGVGKSLWAALMSAARGRSAAKVSLEVSSRNARAVRFYEDRGAAIVGRRPKFYNDGSDAVLMDAPLA